MSQRGETLLICCKNEDDTVLWDFLEDYKIRFIRTATASSMNISNTVIKDRQHPKITKFQLMKNRLTILSGWRNLPPPPLIPID